jgi:beta-lactamase class A
MSNMMKDFLYIVLIVCVPLVTALVKYGINVATNFLSARTQNEQVWQYIREVGDAVTNAVAAMNQKYVDDLKAEGKFDESKQKEILHRAIHAALKSLSSDAQKYLSDTYGDTTGYLETRIEAQINANKRATQKGSVQNTVNLG